MTVSKSEWKKLKLKTGDAIALDWKDHCTSDNSWTDVDDKRDIFEICFIRTIGFVVYEADDIIKVALNMQVTNDVYCMAMNILKADITKVKLISRGGGKRNPRTIVEKY